MTSFSRFHEKVYFGTGSHRAALQHLQDEGIGRIALISDENAHAQGVLAVLQASLREAGLPFDTHMADPAAEYEDIVTLAGRINTQPYGCYLSLGGNFLNFVAKFIWMLAEDPQFDVRRLSTDFVEAQRVSVVRRAGRAIHVAIPAAYMLGGEFGHFVFAGFRDGPASAYLDDALLPTRLVLDPALLTTVTADDLAAQGFDSFTHCIECFAHDVDLPIVKAACLQGAKSLYEHLPALLADQGDMAARTQVQAGIWGGSVAVANLFSGIVHSMTSMYSAKLGVPHGAAHALTLPAAIEFLAEDRATAARLGEMAAHLGIAAATDPQAARKLARATAAFAQRIGLATTVSGAGIALDRFAQLLPEMVDGAAAYQSTRLVSRPVDAAQLRALYEAAAS
jgi:acetaldehyde dehydrogenase/alcohol dehydrogenase